MTIRGIKMKKINLPEDHPLYHPLKLKIMTPAVARMEERLTQWLWTSATGGFIEGPPRFGKSTGISIVADKLRMRYGKPIPSHLYSAPPQDKPTVQGLYRKLCISANLKLNKNKNQNADIYLEDFYHFLVDMTKGAGTDQLVLFVDEMQRMSICQIEALASLHDLMALNGILLSVFFTGNDTECDKLLKQIESHHRRHIMGRFFTQRASFDGICNLSELSSCLKQYDELRYPAEGPTYTGSCLPDEVKNGFKLESLGPEIWGTFREYQKMYKLPRSWGMKYFSATISTLLLDYLPKEGVDGFCPDVVRRCIEVSGLLASNIRVAS